MLPDQHRAEPRPHAKATGGTSAQPLSRRGIAGYCAAAGGTGFYYAFSSAALPLLIPSSNVLLLNLMSNTRSIEGTVVQPIVGAWSDRTWTRLGRRRPFMAAALPLSALFIALTPAAPGLLGIVVCIVLFSLCFNVAFDPYTALEADIAPPAQRPILNGMATTVSFFGQVGLGLVLGFGHSKTICRHGRYVMVALVLLLTWLVTICTMREHQDSAHVQRRYCLQSYVRVLRAHRQAFRCLAAFFCYMSGINVILVNLTPYATHVLHVSKGEALQLFVLVVLMIGLCTLPASWLATRVGIRKVLSAGMVVMAVGAVGVLMADSVATVIPWILVAGIGCGAVSCPHVAAADAADTRGARRRIRRAQDERRIHIGLLLGLRRVRHDQLVGLSEHLPRAAPRHYRQPDCASDGAGRRRGARGESGPGHG